MLMLGLLYLIVTGLSFQVSRKISLDFSISYEFEGVMLMKIICLCFMVGDCASGVYSPLEEKVCYLMSNRLLI